MAEHGLSQELPDSFHGFTPGGGMWLSRKMALGWVKKHEPQIAARLTDVPPEGLHSEIYAAAKGIKQKVIRRNAPPVVLNPDIAHVNLKDKSIFVFDLSGLYTYVADRLAAFFGTVYYYVPNHEASYLTSDRDEIGTGIPGVTRVHDLWKYVTADRLVDYFYFPDMGEGSLQCHLSDLGYPVGGSKLSEVLEHDKEKLQQTMERVGLPYAQTERANGFWELREIMMRTKDKWIKVGWKHRGVFETFHHIDWEHSEEWWFKKAGSVGQYRHTMVILVQDPIPSKAEVAIDGWRVGRVVVPWMVTGIELKDMGLAGMLVQEMPGPIFEVEQKLAPEWERLGYNGPYGNEIRLGEDGESYYVDATCRVGRPPGEIHAVVYTNYGEIVRAVCCGEIPTPEFKHKYVAHILLCSPLLCHQWLEVSFPDSIAPYVKLANYCIKDGEHWCIPDGSGETDTVGAVVGLGDTLREAMDNALKYAEQVKAEKLEYRQNLFDDISKSIEAAKEYGIDYEGGGA
jgi:hypothetical protein